MINTTETNNKQLAFELLKFWAEYQHRYNLIEEAMPPFLYANGDIDPPDGLLWLAVGLHAHFIMIGGLVNNALSFATVEEAEAAFATKKPAPPKNRLNIIAPDPPLSFDQKRAKAVTEKEGYESPIGWWTVSTQGDVEGRSTTKLGSFYGHVAEIALHLADKCFYSLTFDPIVTRAAGERIPYKATGKIVWVMLGAPSGTWDMSPDARAEFFRTWFNTDDVEVLPKTKNATYFASSVVHLKE